MKPTWLALAAGVLAAGPAVAAGPKVTRFAVFDHQVTRVTVASSRRILVDFTRWTEGPDGTIYVTASHIQDTVWFKLGAPASIKTALFSFRP